MLVVAASGFLYRYTHSRSTVAKNSVFFSLILKSNLSIGTNVCVRLKIEIAGISVPFEFDLFFVLFSVSPIK